MTRTKSVLSSRADVVVVGGGLAGLTSATLLARAGYAVTLIEQSQHLGGRAITQNEKGFHFNLGPHGLYRAGQAANILHELGVSWKGGTPTVAGSYAIRQGKPYALPLGLRGLLTSRLFGIAGKLEVSRLLAGLGKIDTTSIQHLSLQDWLHQATRLYEVRQFVEALVRLSTYTNAPERISAGAALAQLQLAFCEASSGHDYQSSRMRSPCAQSCFLMIHPIAIIQLGEVCSLIKSGYWSRSLYILGLTQML